MKKDDVKKRDGRRSLGRSKRKEASGGVWIDDKDRRTCSLCDVKFTMFVRRHHCRICGEIFCSKCCPSESKRRRQQRKSGEGADSGEAGVRTCDTCYTIRTSLRKSKERVTPKTPFLVDKKNETSVDTAKETVAEEKIENETTRDDDYGRTDVIATASKDEKDSEEEEEEEEEDMMMVFKNPKSSLRRVDSEVKESRIHTEMDNLKSKIDTYFDDAMKRSRDTSQWVYKSSSKGLARFTAASNRENFAGAKGVIEMKGSPGVVYAFLTNMDRREEYDAYYDGYQNIHVFDDEHTFLTRVLTKPSFPAAGRDFLVLRHSRAVDEHTFAGYQRSVQSKRCGPDKEGRYVRAELASSIIVEGIGKDNTHSRVTITIDINLMGNLPTWLIRQVITSQLDVLLTQKKVVEAQPTDARPISPLPRARGSTSSSKLVDTSDKDSEENSIAVLAIEEVRFWSGLRRSLLQSSSSSPSSQMSLSVDKEERRAFELGPADHAADLEIVLSSRTSGTSIVRVSIAQLVRQLGTSDDETLRVPLRNRPRLALLLSATKTRLRTPSSRQLSTSPPLKHMIRSSLRRKSYVHMFWPLVMYLTALWMGLYSYLASVVESRISFYLGRFLGFAFNLQRPYAFSWLTAILAVGVVETALRVAKIRSLYPSVVASPPMSLIVSMVRTTASRSCVEIDTVDARSSNATTATTAAAPDKQDETTTASSSTRDDDNDGGTKMSFEDASQAVRSLTDLDNSSLLRLYGLYKFATVGSNESTSRPGMFDLKNRAKWDAWKEVASSGKSQDACKREYVDLALSLMTRGE